MLSSSSKIYPLTSPLTPSSCPQECPPTHDLLNSLRQVEKMLAVHEASYQQGLRSLRKKISALHNSTMAIFKTSCPKPEPPAHGRRLGRVFGVGHEVHFLCKPGYELIGPRTRVCLESLKWSGQQPMCRRESYFQFCVSDIDECHLFPLGQPGRLCIHQCVNTPGSFHCFCPDGYDLAQGGRSCTDIDECENQMHNCTVDQVCVNTFGGFQCVAVECPEMKNATYIKTSPMRCERNPCMMGDTACIQAPNSISFHFLSVVSNMSAPRVLFRVSAARVLGDTLRFGLAGGRGRGHFSMQRSGRQTGTLLLVTPIKGPANLEAEVEMSELEHNTLLGRYLTKVTLFVSPYEF
uniref:Fibulin-7-like n=1 Tax=Acanthochromis polyacanthus TaxID=80966 RepID=A0A3Q1F5G7_9TELE